MKNGWVKIFPGDYLAGADDEKVSWSQTRMEGLGGVMVHHNGYQLSLIRGPGEYHYSEDYEVRVGTDQHDLVVRRVQWFTGEAGWETHELDTATGTVKQYMSENRI